MDLLVDPLRVGGFASKTQVGCCQVQRAFVRIGTLTDWLPGRSTCWISLKQPLTLGLNVSVAPLSGGILILDPSFIWFMSLVICRSTERFDVVLMNPPFGTRRAGIDVIFLERALEVRQSLLR